MDQERLKEVLKDEAFVKELLAMEEPEQVQEALEEKGVPLTLDEIKNLGEFVSKVASGEIPQETVEAMANGELSEAELEEVAGGVVVELIIVLGVAAFFGAGMVFEAVEHRW